MAPWVKRCLLLTLATKFDPRNCTVKERIASSKLSFDFYSSAVAWT
ncbi:hypothetical protein LEMLEM_LOCUS13170 [Lemmus lemmus]